MFLRPLVALISAFLSTFGAPQAVAPPGDVRAASAPAPAVAAPVPVRVHRPPACPSYWTVADDGGVFAAGAAPFAGSAAGRLADAVAVAGTPTGRGYWVAGRDGRVVAFGDARTFGSGPVGGDVVGLAARPAGDGYWTVTATGTVRAFGAAPALGGLEGGRVVGMAATPSGRGYWLVAADGGVFTFGDAAFAGAAAGRTAAPVVGLAPTPTGAGYWLAAADGAVYSFGDAAFHGRAALPRPATGIAASPTGGGYWLLAADGRVAGFGDARAAAPVRYPTMATRMVGLAVPARSLPCPAAERGRKVVFLGDSVMFDVAAGLEPALARVPGVAVASRPWFAYGLDLARDTYDWRREWPAVLRQESPDVVVVLAGFGDLWAPSDAPAERRPETPEWRSRYRAVVTEATAVLTAGGAELVWIGLPWVADTNIYFPDVRARVESLNGVVREVVGGVPGASFVDAAALLAGPDGRYATRVVEQGRVVQLRKPDGLHLCPAGVERVSRAAGTLVAGAFGERLRPGWESGPWRDDVRFHQDAALDCR